MVEMNIDHCLKPCFSLLSKDSKKNQKVIFGQVMINRFIMRIKNEKRSIVKLRKSQSEWTLLGGRVLCLV